MFEESLRSADLVSYHSNGYVFSCDHDQGAAVYLCMGLTLRDQGTNLYKLCASYPWPEDCAAAAATP